MFYHVVHSGGPVLACIALASLVAVAVIIERCWRLLPLRRRFDAHLQQVERELRRGRLTAIDAYLAEYDDGMARVLRRSLTLADQGPDAVRAMGLDAAQQEVPAIERGLGAIATVAQITPLLGLLGTVSGLMAAFESARGADRVTTELLAGGIYEALGTTAAGLTVAIPAWIAYSFLSGLAGRLIEQLEFAANEVPVLLGDGAS